MKGQPSILINMAMVKDFEKELDRLLIDWPIDDVGEAETLPGWFGGLSDVEKAEALTLLRETSIRPDADGVLALFCDQLELEVSHKHGP